MKKVFISVISLIFLVLISCSEDSSTTSPTEQDDYTLSSETLNFGATHSEKQLAINIRSGANLDWTVRKPVTNRWLNIDVESGSQSKVITVSIDRSKLPAGISVDTLTIIGSLRSMNDKNGSEPLAKKDSIKKVTIIAEKIASYSEILQEKIGNSVITLQSYSDSTMSLLASFEVIKTIPVYTAFAAFYAGSKIMADAGTSVNLLAKNGINPTFLKIDMNKQSFSYKIDSVNTLTANYYLPDGGTASSTKCDFDGTTFHRFSVPGNQNVTSFTDSILSAQSAEWTNAPSSISTASDLTINWTPSSNTSDSVYVIIYSKGDTNVRVAAARAVNDDSGTITVSSSLISQLKNAGTEGELWLIRYYIKTDITNRRYLVSQSQRSYSLTIN
ncbi:MAG: hypothetical protein QG635_1996 [Bacteroidota bacterium]|nr:hypothetical protein [Bacteroidota bacterium]